MAEGGKAVSEYSSLYTESRKATTDNSADFESFDVLICYHPISNLREPVAGAKKILTGQGITVKDSDDVSMVAGELKAQQISQHCKHSKYRVCVFNKAFEKHDMEFYEVSFLNTRISTPSNTLILSRPTHKKKIPERLKHLQCESLSNRVDGEEIATKIRTFIERNRHVSLPETVEEEEAGEAIATATTKKTLEYAEKKKQFVQMVDGFSRRRTFVLCASVEKVQQCVRSLAFLPWLKVFDFHRNDESKKLLDEVRMSLQSGNFAVSCKTEKPSKLCDKITDWTLVRWQEEEERDHLNEHISSLARYCSGQKAATMVILWHREQVDDDLEDMLRDFLANVKHDFKPPRDIKFVLCLPSVPEHDTNMARIAKKFVQDRRVVAPLSVTCEWIEEIASDVAIRQNTVGQSELPKLKDEGEGLEKFQVEQSDLNWLTLDMNVLLLDGYDSTNDEELDKRGVDFLNGGDIGWDVIRSGKYDVRRDITPSIIDHLTYKYIDKGASGIVTLFHAPGSGGSTVGRRLLWDLHKRLPCMMLDPKVEIGEDFREKIKYVRENSNLPILLLVDGRSSQEVRNILDVCRYERIIILHVVRYYRPTRKLPTGEGRFFLADSVSKIEAPKFEKILIKHGNAGIKKRMALLTSEVGQGTNHSVFEYGLTAFHSNFRGVNKYVESHLFLSDGEKPWHKAAAFLSLANYYGNCALPAEFFSRILETEHYGTVELSISIPEIGQQLIRECNDCCDWKIPHYMVAKEILEQYLSRKKSDTLRGELTRSACAKLADLACEFLDVAREHLVHTYGIPVHILSILNNIFIFRHNKEANEYDDYQAKSTYSRLISDIGNEENQHKVFSALVANFHSHAEFHAHFGRFLGKTNRHQEAVASLKQAVDIRKGELKFLDKNPSIPDEGLNRIHSMFGFVYNAHVRHMLGNYKVGYILRTACDRIEEKDAQEILNSAIHAIDQFRMSRDNYCPSASPSYGFIGEIQVRLHVTEFCKKRADHNLGALVTSEHPLHFLWDFVCKSFVECEYLLDQCIIAAGDVEIVQRDIEKYLNLYRDYFIRSADKFSRWARDGQTVSAKRCKIALLKLSLNNGRNREFRVFQDLHPSSAREFIDLHEGIFNDKSCSTIRISSYMEDWLKAIRLPTVAHRYMLKVVIPYVKRWDHKGEKGSIATYYNYVLHFVDAILTQTPASVKMVQNLHKNLEESHKLLPRKILETPREWIRSIANNNPPIGVLQHYQQGVQNLQVFTGCVTVAKVWYGHIDVDSAMSSKLDVYFVPQKFGIKSYHGRERAHVEFHIGFNPKKGAQAYDVKLIKTVMCPACGQSTPFLTLTWCPCRHCGCPLSPSSPEVSSQPYFQ